ncbi:MAG: alpha/beta hydrolase [Rhodospirillaceae bacterium]|nr:alpha/beta hydrolase [Rhodospirillaceae bacterium]
MPLHPQIVALIERAAAAGVRPTHELTPEEARTQMEEMSRERDKDRTVVRMVADTVIDGPGGNLALRFYWPEVQQTELAPVIMFFHGGGHVIGSLNSHDLVARNMCADTGYLVVSVDYRMGPEHKFPAAPEDCYAATKWVAENTRQLAVDPDRIAVAGDSAGGTLAAVVAMMAREAGGPALRHQLLIYPVADYAFDTPSYETYAEGAGILTAAGMGWFRDHYLNGPEDRENWRAAPLRAGDFSNLPSATVITAECDILHDEGVALAAALAAAGVSVDHRDYPGMMHGFYSFAPLVDDGRAAQIHAAEALRAGLSV